jgi:hydrogenase maturation protease
MGLRTLVIGMGNPILCDDAVGIRLAMDLEPELAPIPDLDMIADCSVGGLNLVDLAAGYDRLIVFDSIKSEGSRPGTWMTMTGETFRETMNLTNVHDANFTVALELGRHMGMHLPSPNQVHIFAVEILDNQTFSETMSPPLEAAYPFFRAEIRRSVLALLGS